MSLALDGEQVSLLAAASNPGNTFRCHPVLEQHQKNLLKDPKPGS
jgi:hypothetical protein